MLIIYSKKIRKYSKMVKFDLIHPISNPKRYQSIKHYKKKINIRKPKRRKKKKQQKESSLQNKTHTKRCTQKCRTLVLQMITKSQKQFIRETTNNIVATNRRRQNFLHQESDEQKTKIQTVR